MLSKTKLKLLKYLCFTGTALASIYILVGFTSSNESKGSTKNASNSILEQRKDISKLLGSNIKENKLPEKLAGEFDGDKDTYSIVYTIDPALQKEAERLLKSYRPDYGAIFLMDAQTGEVLAMSSYQKDQDEIQLGNLAVQASFPSASVFKVVTATAAVDKAGFLPEDIIHYNGGAHTLYKKNVLSDKVTRWTNKISLRDAFARSINTAFGRLSLEHLTPGDLSDYAERFMFNRNIHADFHVEAGKSTVPTEKGFELAEVASGFTRNTRMSPIQGAMIAASIVNDGKSVAPYIIRELNNPEGEKVYEAKTFLEGHVMTPESASKVRSLMERTVIAGTSRRSFRPITGNRKFNHIEMGGKTGNLTGDQPAGKTDWFVGYAQDNSRKIAVAAITVNKKFWTVKSSYLGQSMFKKYFNNVFAANKEQGPVFALEQ